MIYRPVTAASGDSIEPKAPAENPENPGDAQQQLGMVADGGGQNGVTPDAAGQAVAESVDNGAQRNSDASSDPAELREHLQQAIGALQTLDDEL